MTIHHATLKKAQINGFSCEENEDGTFTVTLAENGFVLVTGTDIKQLVDDASIVMDSIASGTGPEFDAFTAWEDANPQQDTDEEDDEPAKTSGVPTKYKEAYKLREDPDSCSDDLAMTFKEHVTNGDGKLDIETLAAVARVNNIHERFQGYVEKGLNNGMVRMNVGNILRGMQKRGEKVTVGGTTWEAETED